MVIIFKLSTMTTGSYTIIVLFILMGLLFAGIWPLITSMDVYFFPKYSSMLVSLIIMTGGIGAIFSHWITDMVYDKYSLAAAINLVFVF